MTCPKPLFVELISDWQPEVMLAAIALSVALLQGVAAQRPSNQLLMAGTALELPWRVSSPVIRPWTFKQLLASGLPAMPSKAL